MTNQLMLDGNWNRLRGKLRQKWGALTDDDLPQVRGEAEQVIGAIQRRTGETREVIEQYLHEISGSAGSAMGTVRDYAQHASEAVQHTARQATGQVRAGYDEADRFVRNRPKTTLLVCLGVGLIAGALVALSLRSR